MGVSKTGYFVEFYFLNFTSWIKLIYEKKFHKLSESKNSLMQPVKFGTMETELSKRPILKTSLSKLEFSKQELQLQLSAGSVAKSKVDPTD